MHWICVEVFIELIIVSQGASALISDRFMGLKFCNVLEFRRCADVGIRYFLIESIVQLH